MTGKFEEKARGQIGILSNRPQTMVAKKHSEVPLIIFTCAVPASIGVTIAGFLAANALAFAILSLCCVALGVGACFGHLARPLRAPNALRHVSTSWLSREIWAVSLYAGMVALWLVALLLEQPLVATLFQVAAVVFGFVCLYAMAVAYRIHPMPAWDGWEGLMELAGGLLGTGGALSVLLWAFSPTGIPLWAPLPLLVGAALEYGARQQRKTRLKSAPSSAPITATLDHLATLEGRYQRMISLEIAAALLVATAMFAIFPLSALICAIAAFLEGAAHIESRTLFYDSPVQIYHVTALRKR